uniref:Bm535 n=1 Tax=Brugia malayi TaxID=6279 RepID=A0A1I9G0K7_BRUMA|nr:Bm535 [Brugia malayi]
MHSPITFPLAENEVVCRVSVLNDVTFIQQLRHYINITQTKNVPWDLLAQMMTKTVTESMIDIISEIMNID